MSLEISEMLITCGYEIVMLKKIIAEKDGIRGEIEEQCAHVDAKYKIREKSLNSLKELINGKG